MALRAGRVGVNPSEVDTNGKIKGQGGSDLTPRVEKLETSISGFSFRDNDGQPQYRATEEGEWVNFSNGVSLPMNVVTTYGGTPSYDCLIGVYYKNGDAPDNLKVVFKTSVDATEGDEFELIKISDYLVVGLFKLTSGDKWLKLKDVRFYSSASYMTTSGMSFSYYSDYSTFKVTPSNANTLCCGILRKYDS